MEFRSQHAVETAENVPIRMELSGLATRVFAFLIDTVVMVTLMGLLFLLFALPSLLNSTPEISKTAIPLGLFIILFGYHLFQEWLWNGRTIGKRVLNIRVVRDNGQPIGFWEALGRNLLRVLDVYMSGIGLVCMLWRKDEKRFGDLLCGTIVVLEQSVRMPLRPSLQDIEATTAPAGISVLNPEEVELIKAYRGRRTQLFTPSRQNLANSLCRYFSERLHQPIDTEEALLALPEQYHQALR